MRALIRFALIAFAILLLPTVAAVALAQTESLPAIAKETYRPKPELPPPGSPPRAVTERLVAEPRVIAESVPAPPVAVSPPVAVERPVVVERPAVASRALIAPRTTRWWDVLSSARYGFYDDGNVDDNWYYDYYDLPKPAVVVAPSAGTATGYRTAWTYEPVAEAGLFSW